MSTKHRQPWRSDPDVKQNARELRRNQTPAEASLWSHLRARQLDGMRFRRQHPIGPYVVDFYCAESRLVIEVDGDTHAEQVEADQARTAWLESRGYRVIRFTNSEVRRQLEAVIEETAEACRGYPHPASPVATEEE
jgi:very-short-patch-repair endonuclease